MSRREDVALLGWRQLFQRPASFPPLPHAINGDRIQHHTLKPQPKVCQTSAETKRKGEREGKNQKKEKQKPNMGNIFRGQPPEGEKERKEERSRPHLGNASSEHLSRTGSPTQGAIPHPANTFKTQLAHWGVGGGVLKK